MGRNVDSRKQRRQEMLRLHRNTEKGTRGTKMKGKSRVWAMVPQRLATVI